jgi:hypothetical protein
MGWNAAGNLFGAPSSTMVFPGSACKSHRLRECHTVTPNDYVLAASMALGEGSQ